MLAHIFLELMYQDWRSIIHSVNIGVEVSKAKCKKFSNVEFLTSLGLTMGSAEFSQKLLTFLALKKTMMMTSINNGPPLVPGHN